MRTLISAALLGLSLCADCFAVSMCSAVTIDHVDLQRRAWKIGAVFAFVQTGFLLAGWALGFFATELASKRFAYFERTAHIVGFLLLLYVGGAMFSDGIRGTSTHLNLNGFRAIVLGGIATSIDAGAVGLSLALDAARWPDIAPVALSVFLCTWISVLVGMHSGSLLGRRLGHSARIVGGLVLIGLGVNILL